MRSDPTPPVRPITIRMERTIKLPNLNDPNNWMAFAAIAALILSQFPPIFPRMWGRMRGSSVLLTSQDSFGLTHHLGRIFLVVHLQIENTGASPVAISKIDCTIRRVPTEEVRRSKSLWRLPAKVYLAESFGAYAGAGSTLFIGTIHLKPGESWQQVVRCYGSRSLEDEERAQELQDDFSLYISRELENRRRNGEDTDVPVEVCDELVTEARAYTEIMFDLTKGEYEFYIAAIDRSNNVLGVTKAKFILYESMIDLLRRISDDYVHGYGVSLSIPPYKRSSLEPRLVLVGSGQREIRDYKTIVAQ